MSDFKIIIPQKARGKLVESIWTDDAWDAEVKEDGHRRVAQFLDKVRFTGTPSKKTDDPVERTEQVPHLCGGKDHCLKSVPWVAVPKSLRGTVLDGEIILPEGMVVEGSKSKAVGSILNSSPEEAIAKQIARGWLRYVVFDCLYWKGEYIGDRPLNERRSYASCAVRTWDNPYVTYSLPSTDKKGLLKKVLAAGGEGVILKHKDHRYGDAKLWVKYKYEAAADVIVTGFKAAKELSKKKGEDEATMTKYAAEGLIGAVLCGQYRKKFGEIVEVASISGMGDDLRRDLTKNPKKYMGKVVRIKHNGREPTGRFRHPRWDDLRDDKRADQCILDLNEV